MPFETPGTRGTPGVIGVLQSVRALVVPGSDGFIQTGGGKPSGIEARGDRGDLVGMAGERGLEAAGRRVPDGNLAVAPGREA